MADNQVEIKVVTDTDLSQVESLEDKLEEAKARAEELREELEFSEEFGFTNDVEELEEELAQAEEEVANLSDELGNIDGGSFDEASSSAEGLADSTSNADQEIENLGNDLSLLESSALLDIADQVGTLGANAEGMAQDMNTAAISVGQLATNVGMAEPQMVSLINHISNATFPQEEAMAYVNALNQMGVSSDQLGAAATNMDKINDATHVGYQSVMNLTAGLRSMGITADNLPASFNAIAYAEDNVYNGTETLAQVLKTQAGNINEYGLSIDQLVVVLGTLQSQTGLTGRKLSSELGNRLKECNGDIGALEQSLGLANGTLANASQLTGQYSGKLQTLANEEAEHKTFLDQINAAWEDMQLALSPVLTPLTEFAGLIGGFGSFAMQINGIIKLAQTFGLLGAAESSLIPVQWAEAAAGWASIGWILVAVAAGIALGLALIWLYNNCDWFRQGVDNLVASLQWLAGVIYNNIMAALQWLSDQFNQFTQQLGLNTDDWIQAVLGFILFLPTLPARVAVELANTIAKALGFGDNFVQTMIDGASRAVNGFVSWITQLPGKLAGELEKMLQMAQEFVMKIANLLTGGAAGMVVGWITGSGESSPGYMYDAFQGELSEMAKLPGKYGGDITGGMRNVGAKMVSGFNPDMTFANGSTALIGGGDTVINIYGDVDSDRRVKQIVEAVRRELNFDNRTAGRSV